MKVKPVVSIVDCIPTMIDKVRTEKAGLDRVIELVKEKMAGSKIKGMTVVQTNIPDRAKEFADRVRAEFDYDGEIIINDLGSAVAVHFGPGCLGLIAYGE